MMIFWHSTGPLLEYLDDGVLRVSDLNPQFDARWRVSRREMFRIGFRFILAATIDALWSTYRFVLRR